MKLPLLSEKLIDRSGGILYYGLLKAMSLKFMFDSEYRRNIYDKNGGGRHNIFNATLEFLTRDNEVSMHAIFRGGRMLVRRGAALNPNSALIFKDRTTIRKVLTSRPEELLDLILRNEVTFRGNLNYLARFSFMASQLRSRNGNKKTRSTFYDIKPKKKKIETMRLPRCDAVRYLVNPSLGEYSLKDFPRLEGFLSDFFSTFPEICTERPRLLTEFLKNYGFELDKKGNPIDPQLRQGEAMKYLMSHKEPIIRDGDLIAGTTTAKKVGVVIYPECGGLTIWPELRSMEGRELNPYRISKEDIDLLNFDIFPFWMDRNVREAARAKFNNPTSMMLDEKFVLYFMWKNHALSHTIPNFPAVLRRGLKAIASEAAEGERKAKSKKKKDFYRSMRLSLEGIMIYAQNLSTKALSMAQEENDPCRARELRKLARICRRVPTLPARTLEEAVNAIWITWVAIHMENTNAGLSLGRLDKWLNTYFLADMKRAKTEASRKKTLKKAIELVGYLFLRCTDHLPLVADVGSKLFAGSSSSQALTIGGVKEDGSNAVCDMTYIILKVAEMLTLRDPNLNARYHHGVNSDHYLRRLCEVNMVTGSAPSIHNDRAMIASLENQGFKKRHARDWCATGCVEPTSAGRHYGHTNCMLLNLVAPLEMTFYNGYHPLVGEVIGPRTGDISEFDSFDKFKNAYYDQLTFLIEQSIECNNFLGEAHKFVRPTPLLSSLIDGPMNKGEDLVKGGAVYNSSGAALVAISDIVDSLMTVKKLVYEERRLDLKELLAALRSDFNGYEALHKRIMNKVPKFGSGDEETTKTAQELIDLIYDVYQSHKNYRGGRYTSGFWSMSNHVAFGNLSGALPSGRRRFAAFTPGITPSPRRTDSLLDNIHTIAALNSLKMPNNIAFNVKVVPDSKDTHEESLNTMNAYARTYFENGGMQIQFNVMSTQTLKDAMKNPENYRNLMVRISGYNAYFVELNREMQEEIIGRTEHKLGG